MMTPQDENVKTKFHFPGDGIIPPMNIEADTREEAVKIYEEKFKNKKDAPVQEQSTVAPEIKTK